MTDPEVDQFCRKFVEDLFEKHDSDKNNILDKRQIKLWMNKEMSSRPLHKKIIQREFQTLINNADTNRDGKIDKWELYQYCLRSSTLE